MSTLIVTLPSARASASASDGAAEYDYLHTLDGAQVAAQGRTRAALLPTPTKPGAQVVALVPASALSWHQVTLPLSIAKSLRKASADPTRLRAVLVGLLEERLLDDAEQLHFAVFPGTRPDTPAWVAVCQRSWLREALQALESAGRSVSRIVPELAPLMEAANAPHPPSATVQITPGQAPAELLLSSVNGAWALPLGAASVALATQAQPGSVQAEPAVAALAERSFSEHAVTLQSRAERSLQAALAPWNLAQFEFSPSSRARLLKASSLAWASFLRAPQWRPTRWGLAALLLTLVLGLNAFAWREKDLLTEKRASVTRLLQQTFPDVRVVIDPPLQMARELTLLQEARGLGGSAGVDTLLSTLASAAPSYQPITHIEASTSDIKLTGPALSAAEAASLSTQLAAQGLRARWQGAQLVIERGGAL